MFRVKGLGRISIFAFVSRDAMAEKKDSSEHFRRSGFDRRRYTRVRSHSLVRCTQVNEKLRDWLTNLKDISIGGVKMLCTEHVHPNDIVRLVINFESLNMTITIAAKVVWVTHKRPKSNLYEAGFSFLELPAPERATVDRYVQTHLNMQD